MVVSPDEVNKDMQVEWAQCIARADRWEEEVTLLQEEMRRVVQFLAWRSRKWFLRINARAGTTTSVVRAGISSYAKKQESIYRNLAIQFSRCWHSALQSLHLPHMWAARFLDMHGAPLVDLDNKKTKKATQNSCQTHGAISESEDSTGSESGSDHSGGLVK